MLKNNKKIPSHIAFGKEGEEKAQKYLINLGYSIITTNYIFKPKYGEIDIIIKKKEIIAFVEVKTRNHKFIKSDDIVNKKKQINIIQTSFFYLKSLGINHNDYVIRYDICYIHNDTIEYIENAFTSTYE